MRINEVARELGVDNKAILDYLESLGITGKAHSSRVEGVMLARVKEKFGGSGSARAEASEASETSQPSPDDAASQPAAQEASPPPALEPTETPADAPPKSDEPAQPGRPVPTLAELRESLQRTARSKSSTSTPAEDSVRSALHAQMASRPSSGRRMDGPSRGGGGQRTGFAPSGPAPASDDPSAPPAPRFREKLTTKAQTAAREAMRKKLAGKLGGGGVMLRPLPAQEEPPATQPDESAAAQPPADAQATPADAATETTPQAPARPAEPRLTPEQLALQMIGEPFERAPVVEEEAPKSAPAKEEEKAPQRDEPSRRKDDESNLAAARMLRAFGGREPAPTVQQPSTPSKPSSPPGRPGQRLPAGRKPAKSRKSIRRQRRARYEMQEEQRAIQEEMENKTLRIHEATTVADIASGLRVPPNQVIAKLFALGIMATINQRLDNDTIQILADEFGFVVEETTLMEDGLDVQLLEEDDDDDGALTARAPVVTVMGHVDHGKTKLLDAIRNANVVDSESGGITQHIGAYRVVLPSGEITFLDTPGHAAFTSMRARGAQVTDIVILVVAADDGVMPQTVEAINHAKAADTPIIVAVNKIDKPDANPDRVMQQLSDHGLMPEAWGGKTIYCPVSALQAQGIDTLLESVLLQAEVLELRANPNRPARGTIIEARLDPGRGPVSTLLVETGTLRMGDPIVVGVYSGRVRAMQDHSGIEQTQAAPGVPVEVLGISGVPEAGDRFYAVKSDREAKVLSLKLQQVQRGREMHRATRVHLETFFSETQGEEAKSLDLIIKGDVMGSVDALSEAMLKQSTEKVAVNVVHKGVGAVSESDVLLAAASNALIIGFKVRPGAGVDELARRENVEIRTYDVIYDATDEVQAAMLGLLDKKFEERVTGRAEVRMTFRVSGVGMIAGCHVADGKLVRNSLARLVRDGAVVYDGTLSSLKRHKDDVREVTSGFECGCGLANFNDVKVGDQIECYERIEVEQTL